MKSKLIKITDETINSLLKQDIILPSTYFKEFDKNAKLLEIDMQDEEFEKEVNEVIIEEFSTINSYMNNTISNIQKISTATKNATTAIKNRDENELTKIYQEMEELKKEIDELQHEIYIDSLTHTLNKKWIYSEFVNEMGNTQNSGVMTLLFVNDYGYIKSEHGDLLADNLLIFISKFLSQHLNEEDVNFKIARYSKDRFLLLFEDANLRDITMLLNNVQKNLLNSTLKSKSGILIKSSFKFNLMQYKKDNDFQNMLELLLNDMNNQS